MGDLAHKKIFPALYHMVRHGHLDVPVIGVARAARTDEHLKSECAIASSSKAAASIKRPWPSF
jgi:glucose-6-phosphate 1-dehydrogenase